MSIFGAYGLASFLANQLNVDIVGFRMPPSVLAVEIGAALLVPMAAAFFPIRSVVSQPAREAIAGTTTAPVEETPADRIIARIQRLGRPTRLAPRMVDGRWLLPDDDRAIVLSSNILQKIPGTRIGDEITLRLGDKDYGWRIVRLVEELIPPTSPVQAYVPLDAFTAAAGLGIGRTDTLRAAIVGHDASSHWAIVADLEQRLDAAGFDVRLVRSRSEDRAILADRFNLISIVMSIMSLLIAIVGGLGLAGTMSMNVLERMREIGVMRAIGATDGAIRQIVLSEGLVIAALAWLIATLISLPMSYAMSFAIGQQLLSSPLIWTYAFAAVAFWLLAVLVIAVVASLLPARTAVQLTVRDTLTYE